MTLPTREAREAAIESPELVFIDVELLRLDQAIFILKALVIAGHISVHTLRLSINLANTMPL